MFSEYWLLNVGDLVENNLKQPIGFLFMMFSSREEMEDVLINSYKSDLVKIEKLA